MLVDSKATMSKVEVKLDALSSISINYPNSTTDRIASFHHPPTFVTVARIATPSQIKNETTLKCRIFTVPCISTFIPSTDQLISPLAIPRRPVASKDSASHRHLLL
jgi:hypothetical protein